MAHGSWLMAQGSWLMPQCSWLKTHGQEKFGVGSPRPSNANFSRPWATSFDTWALSHESPLTIGNRLINELFNSMFRSFKVPKFQDSNIPRLQASKIPQSQILKIPISKFLRTHISNIFVFEVPPFTKISIFKLGLFFFEVISIVWYIHIQI